jgi:enoyl-CoA hydratase/carnithine racemase
MTTPNLETLTLQREGRVAIIELNRPEVMNAINMQMRQELRTTLEQIRHDSSIAVVILSAVPGKAFCAGMDLREFAKVLEQTPLSELRRFRWEMGEGIAEFDKPIIAAINGLAIGGGVELALMCDICFASTEASFAFAETSRGLIPGNGATQRLSRRIGRARALEMILSAQTVNAHDALDMGLVDHVVSPVDLLAKARALAEKIAANAPIAVRTAKAAIDRGLEMTLKEGLNLERDLATFIYTTNDAKEGPLAFIQKRPAQWKDC